ncbi:hypothetical protein J6590_036468 [Homalodisca vitripennis]|nr:hypothetical protein J6590_036468 [Homalodisca vitripennis]
MRLVQNTDTQYKLTVLGVHCAEAGMRLNTELEPGAECGSVKASAASALHILPPASYTRAPFMRLVPTSPAYPPESAERCPGVCSSDETRAAQDICAPRPVTQCGVTAKSGQLQTYVNTAPSSEAHHN